VKFLTRKRRKILVYAAKENSPSIWIRKGSALRGKYDQKGLRNNKLGVSPLTEKFGKRNRESTFGEAAAEGGREETPWSLCVVWGYDKGEDIGEKRHKSEGVSFQRNTASESRRELWTPEFIGGKPNKSEKNAHGPTLTP